MNQSSQRPDMLVFLGRFQPIHNGHMAVIRQALEEAPFLMIGIGSANEPRTVRNPFTSAEREMMIRRCLTGEENKRVICMPIEDSSYNTNDWIERVQVAADTAMTLLGITTAISGRKPAVSLIGHSKDHSSFYLKLFPQWESINVDNYLGLSATRFRDFYFSDEEETVDLALDEDREDLPIGVIRFLESFMNEPAYLALVEEQAFYDYYKTIWKSAPYAPIFVTTDAVVVCGGHVLLIERKAHPGRGLWACPGGFLEQNEYIIDGIIRELREETGLKVPTPVLKASMVGLPRVFDAPFRSLRGRTITNAQLFVLNDTTLPKVAGGDDASKARWVPLAEVKRENMFEDHFHLVNTMVRGV